MALRGLPLEVTSGGVIFIVILLIVALAAFYAKVKVAHVEAGLRTGNIYEPFPEEMNRRLSTRLASLHLAATDWAARNLLAEGVAAEGEREDVEPGIADRGHDAPG